MTSIPERIQQLRPMARIAAQRRKTAHAYTIDRSLRLAEVQAEGGNTAAAEDLIQDAWTTASEAMAAR